MNVPANASPNAADKKAPRPVLDTVLAFPPNRDTLGATAYLIRLTDTTGQPAYLLVDAPPWDEATQTYLQKIGVRWLCMTHRGSLGKAAAIQKALQCEVVIQEQEAYLLPETPVTSFRDQFEFNAQCQAIWTPGHSPGSACVYYQAHGGVLFTGRHLLPDKAGNPQPLRIAKTFHWPRQLQQVQRLQQQFSPETLAYLCPGANTGFLRGERLIDNAYERLQAIDVEAHRADQPLL